MSNVMRWRNNAEGKSITSIVTDIQGYIDSEYKEVNVFIEYLAIMKGRLNQYIEYGTPFENEGSRLMDYRYKFNDMMQSVIKYGELNLDNLTRELLEIAFLDLIPEIKAAFRNKRYDVRYYAIKMLWKVGSWSTPLIEEIVSLKDRSLRHIALQIPREIIENIDSNQFQAMVKTKFPNQLAEAHRAYKRFS